MSSYNRHHGFFDGFWSTGIWVGLRIYLIPCLLLWGVYATTGKGEAGEGGEKLGGHLANFKVMDNLDSSLGSLQSVMGQATGQGSVTANILGFGGGAVRGSSGAKFIRP